MCSTRDRQRAIVLAAVKDKPFGWPRKARPSLTATRHDGAVELRSGRKNGSAGVKQKNGYGSRFRAKNLSSRYARVAIKFLGTKNRNNREFSHQTPWWCLQGQALRVAAKSAAILDRHSTRWRSRTAVGAEEWLRRGQTKEWVRKQ